MLKWRGNLFSTKNVRLILYRISPVFPCIKTLLHFRNFLYTFCHILLLHFFLYVSCYFQSFKCYVHQIGKLHWNAFWYAFLVFIWSFLTSEPFRTLKRKTNMSCNTNYSLFSFTFALIYKRRGRRPILPEQIKSKYFNMQKSS